MRRLRKFFWGHWSRGGNCDSIGECSVDGSRFLKPVARTKVFNFAAENMKQSKKKIRKVNAAEGVRDVFG